MTSFHVAIVRRNFRKLFIWQTEKHVTCAVSGSWLTARLHQPKFTSLTVKLCGEGVISMIGKQLKLFTVCCTTVTCTAGFSCSEVFDFLLTRGSRPTVQTLTSHLTRQVPVSKVPDMYYNCILILFVQSLAKLCSPAATL